ncbi:MAG: hypothetical protein NW205_08115 [Hyphomicrobiaceae bacterium]|nr:hypothetical protein [Hyphomicrobiaceae bacterium]
MTGHAGVLRGTSMHGARRALMAALVMAGGLLPLSPASAQEGPGGAINPGRDCKTIRTCNYARGGSYLGCVSSYSCRVCRFVPSRCDIDGSRRSCQRLSCSWG